MPIRIDIDPAVLSRMWLAGDTTKVIGKLFGCTTDTIINRAYELKLPERGRGWQHAVRRNNEAPPRARVAVPPVVHLAAVRMPDMPLQARADWPELLAAVERAKGCKAPQATLAIIATRYRLPVAVVQGLAARVWR